MTVTRVALLDNTTNISYVLTKLLRSSGISADLIQERGAPFNQQPVWEDEDLVEPTGRRGEAPPAGGYWSERERAAGWARPPYVLRPSLTRDAITAWPRFAARAARSLTLPTALFGAASAARSLPVIAAAAEHEQTVTLGSAAVEAFLAGRPYTIIVTGWDVRELPFLTGARNPLLRARASLQRKALAEARAILVQPASDLPHLERLGLVERAVPFNIPVDLAGYARITSRPAEEVFGPAVADRLRGKTVFFAPARIHFSLKRNDMLIEAFATVARQAPVHLLMLEWGPDSARARAMVDRLGISAHVSFLPFVMSKIRLVRAFRLVDVVTDQFLYTAYGSITREALACGRPLISSYDPGHPQPHPADDPAPIAHARTVDTVAAACVAFLDPQRRATVSAAAQAWAERQNDRGLHVLRSAIAAAA